MRGLPTITRFTRDQRGFTLVETLVAMISAVVVVGALYAILDISVQQAAKISDTSQATQLGRITMVKLTEELETSCLSSGFAPVQAASKEKEVSGSKTKELEESRLIFINATSKAAAISEAFEHEIVWKRSTGLLTDISYKNTGGSWPSFTWTLPLTKTGEVRLGENVSQTEVINEKSEKELLPIFKYFKYNKTAGTIKSAKSTEALGTLQEVKLEEKGLERELGSKNAKETAGVEIAFNQLPVDKFKNEHRAVDFKNEVTLSLSVPNAETPVEEKPCE